MAEAWFPPPESCTAIELEVASGQRIQAYGGHPLYGYVYDREGQLGQRVLVAQDVWTAPEITYDLFSTGQAERERTWLADIGGGTLTVDVKGIVPGVQAWLQKNESKLPFWPLQLEPFDGTVARLGGDPTTMSAREYSVHLTAVETTAADDKARKARQLRVLDSDALVEPEVVDIPACPSDISGSNGTGLHVPHLRSVARSGRLPAVDCALF